MHQKKGEKKKMEAHLPFYLDDSTAAVRSLSEVEAGQAGKRPSNRIPTH